MLSGMRYPDGGTCGGTGCGTATAVAAVADVVVVDEGV
jgi:hypothetical protein